MGGELVKHIDDKRERHKADFLENQDDR